MYIGNDLITKLIIGGGYYTESHKRSGGWRIDFVQQEGLRHSLFDKMRYILDADNGDGTRYAVYQVLNSDGTATNIFAFAVHIRNVKKGTFDRGKGPMFDFVPGKYFHLHVKIGGYSSTTTNYLKFLDYVSPRIDMRTNYTPDIYHGANKGNEIPGTLPVTTPVGARKMQSIQYKFKTKVIVKDGLILRSKPDKNSERLALIPANTEINCEELLLDAGLVDGTSAWVGTTYENQSGYAWGGGVELPKVISFAEKEAQYEKQLKEEQVKYDKLDQQNDQLALSNQSLEKENVSLKTTVDSQSVRIDEQAKQLTQLNAKLASWNAIKKVLVSLISKLSFKKK